MWETQRLNETWFDTKHNQKKKRIPLLTRKNKQGYAATPNPKSRYFSPKTEKAIKPPILEKSKVNRMWARSERKNPICLLSCSENPSFSPFVLSQTRSQQTSFTGITGFVCSWESFASLFHEDNYPQENSSKKIKAPFKNQIKQKKVNSFTLFSLTKSLCLSTLHSPKANHKKGNKSLPTSKSHYFFEAIRSSFVFP